MKIRFAVFILEVLVLSQRAIADRLCPPSRIVREITIAETQFFHVAPETARVLRQQHWVALPTETLEINLDLAMAAYLLYFPSPRDPSESPSAPGVRVRLSPQISPAVNARFLLNEPPELRDQVNRWASEVLATARVAYPDEDLVVDRVDYGVGWDAGFSTIHPDGPGTYLHATCTRRGKSTIVLKPSGVAKLRFNGTAIVNRIVSRDAHGNLLVRESSRDPRTVLLTPDDYEQPPTGQTVLFSGQDHVEAVPGVEAVYHASAISPGRIRSWERETLFLGIGPRRLVWRNGR